MDFGWDGFLLLLYFSEMLWASNESLSLYDNCLEPKKHREVRRKKSVLKRLGCRNHTIVGVHPIQDPPMAPLSFGGDPNECRHSMPMTSFEPLMICCVTLLPIYLHLISVTWFGYSYTCVGTNLCNDVLVASFSRNVTPSWWSVIFLWEMVKCHLRGFHGKLLHLNSVWWRRPQQWLELRKILEDKYIHMYCI